MAERVWIAVALAACGGACGGAAPPANVPEPRPHAAQSCELPRGVTLRDFGPRERGLVARRLFACNDFRRGRITQADYARMVEAIDAEWAALPEQAASPAPAPIAWASSVRGFSSQYGTPGWGAVKVLGPPDVFPRHGDIPEAWASRGADDGVEWIEVGFDRVSSIAAVVIYETFNPGAISRVAMTSDSGGIFDAPAGGAVAETSPEGSVLRRFDLGCTPYRVRAIRLELDSLAVLGWNEIDAIGIVPCGP
jgi:speckle-type POZ protein